MRKSIMRVVVALAALAMPQVTKAADIVVHYPMPGFFKSVMDQISTEYMK